MRYWDGSGWTEFTSPSNEQLRSHARYDALHQRLFLAVWAIGLGLGWIFTLWEWLFGHDKPPLPFVLVWLCVVGIGVPVVVSRTVHRLEVEAGQLFWQTLLRRGSFPLGELRSITLKRTYVLIRCEDRTLYLLDSAALRPFVDVLRRTSPSLAVDPNLYQQTKWWRRSQMKGRFVSGR